MSHPSRSFLVAGLLLTLAGAAIADDKCLVKAVLGGKPVTMKSCVISIYDESSVTLFFTESPLPAEEAAAFQFNSYPQDKDAAGKPRSMVAFAFCPGGEKKIPSPAAVKSVEMNVAHPSSPFLGRQWVFDLPKDKEILKIEKLSGKLALGGRLAGRITGGKTSDGLKYSWEADFDVQLPQKASAAGQACGP
ncbi:MAG TPA: hypothetical protein VER78_00605 [Thermoanaerobaculia bacterium]|nr:hypothetical protein [Thermoanaerobaculia bacterium]